jgi:hypothetical protein
MKLQQLKNKKSIRVAFFVRHRSQWKYEILFKLFLGNSVFSPFIVAIPDFSNSNWRFDYKLVSERFTNPIYNLVKSYDENENKWVFDKNLNSFADIVFFTRVIEDAKNLSILNLKNSLNCYVPYSIYSDNNLNEQYNLTFHHLLWKHFLPSKDHEKDSKNFDFNNNVLVSGYPGCDVYLDKSYVPKKVWKKTRYIKKKIIWAPHWTIDDLPGPYFSNFLLIFDKMIFLAKKYKKFAQFAFKPHPYLKTKLYNHPDWGINKTDLYYRKWLEINNCQLEEGEYEDLFLGSDALIHDSVSFISEYLFIGKPSCFVLKRPNIFYENVNSFGEKLSKTIYFVNNSIEIENFIINVINENDKKNLIRQLFLKETLVSSNNVFASEIIYKHICEKLKI